MYYVIGSGLSGVMCAKALLAKGKEVTMLDVGKTPAKEIIAYKRTLAEQDPSDWNTETLSRVSGTLAQTKGKVPSRLYFNSDYMYADTDLENITQVQTNCRMSHAQGGLAQVWGAACLPITEEEFVEWPFRIDRMTSHYKAVAEEIGLTGTHDSLEKLFPFYGEVAMAGELSNQAKAIEGNFVQNQEALKASGIIFGRSRLAYRATTKGQTVGCRKCALCLSGCPFDIIYSATDTLRELKKDPHFTYRDGIRVERLEEEQQVIIHATKDDAPVSFEAERVFVGCGPLGTLKLISASLPEVTDFSLRYQPYFMLPMLSFKNVREVSKEKLHTMAQLFIEIADPKISKRLIHTQLYTYSPQIQSEIDRMFGKMPLLKKIANRFLTGRLMLIQGYLHASDALPITATKEAGKLVLSAPDETLVHRAIKKVARKLFKSAFLLRMLPVLPMLKFGQPGDGNHAGASFPMKVSPSKLESDVYGRILGWSRIHIIDSSVLSNIPAPTISYTVMANAHRIGTECATLDN